jgi:hypothetical protein
MPLHHLPAISAPAAPYLLLILGTLALLVVYLLIALVEGVALTLLGWNPFRTSLTVSVIMNIIAGVINGPLLVSLQHTPLVWLPVSFILSLLIDAFILTYFKRQAIRQNSIFALLVNLLSYILLIFPAYYFGTHP